MTEDPHSHEPQTEQLPTHEKAAAALETKIKSFFSWYILGLIADPLFPKNQQDLRRMKMELSADFTKEFPKIQQNSNADPILCAQDFFNEWSFAVEAKYLDEKSVIVTLGPPPKNPHRLLLTLTGDNDETRIRKIALYRENPND